MTRPSGRYGSTRFGESRRGDAPGVRTEDLPIDAFAPGEVAPPVGPGLFARAGRASFEEALSQVAAAPPRGPDYVAIQHSRSFAELRGRLRRFVFPMTAAFLAWYLVYVLLAAYAHAFMATPVLGMITVGMLLGVAQFATTLLITFSYVSYARRTLDPQVARVRAEAGEP